MYGFTTVGNNSADPVCLGVSVEGDLRGTLFEARVCQRFKNAADTNVEVVYTFPLPYGAILLGVVATLGGKELSGVVTGKQEAESRYEEAMADGDAAIMLEKNRDGSYSLNLGNMLAGESAEVRFRYAQVLSFSQNSLRLMIPTVIAPKYGDPIRQGGLQPHQVPEYDMLAEYPFALILHLHGELSDARISSPSHPISVEHSPGQATVATAREAYLDRDFVLCLEGIKQDSLYAAGIDPARDGGESLLIDFCPRLKSDERGDNDVRVKILVDCSGSMSGDSIREAKDALREIIEGLRQGDRFSLSRFGSHYSHRSRQLCTAASKNSALQWCDRLDANMGGTEMEAALQSTFRLGGAGFVGCDVLLITDGEVYAMSGVLDSARQSGHRVFVVGIGSSPEESLLRKLAEETGGACDFVSPGENVRPAITRMFARLRSQRVTDLRLTWPEGTTVTWQSPLTRSLFDGDSVHVYAQVAGAAEGDVALTGRIKGAGEPVRIAKAQISKPSGEMAGDDAVPRVVGFGRYEQEKKTGKENAAKTALDYQLVTDMTNFLMIHERDADDKATEMPELTKVAQMMPAGWGGMGSVDDYVVCCERVAFFDFLLEAQFQEPQEPHIASLIGLQNWLNNHPEAEWPKSLIELESIGILLPETLNALKELLEDATGTQRSEIEVVKIFLSFVAEGRSPAESDEYIQALWQAIETIVEECYIRDLKHTV
ncbi:MAG: VIT and VWA domain-containing protein [Gracilibacteraceae bacterium]|jgi:Ca-activated chloride channel family protein|nr:VIT and VWA domain-containing protein [Gracilibacteraceae bacterium]